MSRSAEEQLLLEQRIEAMKRKNEELRRRHLEVEADKQSAAKQNALVSVNVPHDDDWIPGRHDDNPRQERHPHKENSPSSNQDTSEDRRQRYDQRRSKNDGYRDDGFNRHGDYRPSPNFHNSNSGKRSEFQGNRYKSDGDRFQSANENRRSGDWSGRAMDGPSGRHNEWGSYDNRRNQGNQSAGASDSSKGYSAGSTFTSKVYKNSAMDSNRGKRPSYRLAEGDGPPPDPSYSFLGDSMRDSPESGDRRKAYPNRRGFPRRGRGGQTFSNRTFNDNRRGEDHNEGNIRPNEDAKLQSSYDAWRQERNLIDQERINRQKTSDGSWSREWDCNKVMPEENDRPHRWRRGNRTPNYNRGQTERGYHDGSNNAFKPYYKHRDNSVPNSEEAATSSDNTPLRTKYTRRGGFTHHSRAKDQPKFRNGSEQSSSVSDVEVTKEAEDAALIQSSVATGEQLKVSVLCDASGGQIRRSVEGAGGSLRISLSNDGESPEGVNTESIYPRKNSRKGKRSRVLSSTSTGTTGTGEEDDGSWEDVTSEEENVSVVTELQKVPYGDQSNYKSIDVSSGPESLDPIPAPGKEDEFLWDDFHPAGFQDNITPEMHAEIAYKALLDEKAKQEVNLSNPQADESTVGVPQHQISFRLDTSCLDGSDDDLGGAKLDPLLVTTQIVQAEVDCMSLTSLPTDVSLPDDIAQLGKVKGGQGETISEEEGASSVAKDFAVLISSPTAEELSGPVSILELSNPGQSQNSDVARPCENPVINSDKLISTDSAKPEFEVATSSDLQIGACAQEDVSPKENLSGECTNDEKIAENVAVSPFNCENNSSEDSDLKNVSNIDPGKDEDVALKSEESPLVQQNKSVADDTSKSVKDNYREDYLGKVVGIEDSQSILESKSEQELQKEPINGNMVEVFEHVPGEPDEELVEVMKHEPQTGSLSDHIKEDQKEVDEEVQLSGTSKLDPDLGKESSVDQGTLNITKSSEEKPSDVSADVSVKSV